MKKLIKTLFDRTFLTFLVVGVINTLFGTAVMFLAYNLLHLNYWVSTAANYVLGSILSYFLNKRFTFRNQSSHKKTAVRFIINIAVCYAVAYGAARPLVRLALSGAGKTVQDNVAMLAGMVLFVVLNYFGQRFFAFREEPEEPQGERRTPMDRLLRLNRSRRAVLAAAGAIFVCLLVLNLLTPYVADDYVYLFSLRKDHPPLTGLWSVAESMYYHCFYMNGRVVSHFFGQLFMLFPKPVFDAVNALVYAGAMYLLYRVCRMDGEDNLLLFLAVCAAFWTFLPAFGQVCLWQIGSVNYLWALLWGLIYLLPFLHRFWSGGEPLPRLWQKVLFCLFALPFGMYTEITSFIAILTAAALLLLCPPMKKGTLRCWLWIPIAVGLAGFAIMLMMPAELGAKTGSLTLGVLLDNFLRSTAMLRDHCLPLLLAWAAAFVLGLYAKLPPERLILSLVLACAAVAANYMLIVAQYYAERCLCTTVLLLVAACGLLAAGLLRTRFRIPCACAGAVLAAVFLLSFALGSADILRCHLDFRAREQTIAEYKAAGETDLVLDRIQPDTPYSAFYDLRDLATDTADTWPNSSMARYYGVDSILGR